MRRPRGFTLVEMTVWLVLFSLISGTTLATLILSVRTWTTSTDRVRAQQGVRIAMSAMTAEMRQGIADTDPGVGGQPPTGYLSITPAVTSTATLMPNANTQAVQELTFTVPSAGQFDPSRTGWSMADPSNYARIRYYVEDGVLRRQEVRFDSGGTAASTQDDVLVSPSNGSVQLSAAYLSPTSVSVSVAVQEGSSSQGLTQILEVVVR